MGIARMAGEAVRVKASPTKRVVMSGILLASSYGGIKYGPSIVNDVEGAIHCIHQLTHLKPCSTPGLFKSQPEAKGTVKDMKVVGEQRIGTAAFVTAGEVEQQVKGFIEIDYREDNLALSSCPPKWVKKDCYDGQYFMDSKKNVTLRYTPCIEVASDYTKLATEQQAQYAGHLTIKYGTDPTTGKPTIVADTDPILPCGIHVDDSTPQASAANASVFRYVGSKKEKESYRRTVEAEGRNLAVLYGAANACEANMTVANSADKIGFDTLITTVVRGEMASNPDPNIQALANPNVPVVVNYGDPAKARQQELDALNKAVSYWESQKLSVPDSNNHRDKITRMDIQTNTFQVVKCPDSQVPQIQRTP